MFNDVHVARMDINDYYTEYYFSALAIYNRYKRFGFPWVGGWQEQPEYIVNIIEMFDVTLEKYNIYKARKK